LFRKRRQQDDSATSHRIDVIDFLSHRKASFGNDSVDMMVHAATSSMSPAG
jgi:hypothetical protein